MANLQLDVLKDYTWGVDPKVLKPIDDAIHAAHGDAEALRAIEDELAAALKTDLSHDAKDVLCRKLMRVGTAACVPTLAELLGDEKLSHMARYALERIPAAEAGAALREALGTVSNELKVGVISSLGVRQDDDCVGTLGGMLGHDDDAVALAAARGLAAIRSEAAAAALAKGKPSAAAQDAADDAALACAETLLSAGKKGDAMKIYVGLKSSEKKHVKLAATRGILACAKSK